MMGRSWNSKRFVVQGLAFSLLLVIPFFNFYLGWNFLQGWYQSIGIGDFWIVSPLEGLESILVSREFFGPLVVAMILPVILALLMGRIFCGWICPIHFLSECIEKIYSLFFKKTHPKARYHLFRELLLVAFIMELLFTLILGAPIFVILSPPGLVGRELMMLIYFHKLAVEGVFVLVVLVLNLISRRFFCRFLCPLGGMLALLGFKRQLRVVSKEEGCVHCNRCERSCPLSLNAGKGEGRSLYCWSCGTCIDSCRQNQLHFHCNRIV